MAPTTCGAFKSCSGDDSPGVKKNKLALTQARGLAHSTTMQSATPYASEVIKMAARSKCFGGLITTKGFDAARLTMTSVLRAIEVSRMTQSLRSHCI
eukprot:4842578-Amphidinium_carterae.2